MADLNPIDLRFNIPQAQQQVASLKELMQKQSAEHTALLAKQTAEEDKAGANIGAIRAKYSKLNTDLAKKQAVELGNIHEQANKLIAEATQRRGILEAKYETMKLRDIEKALADSMKKKDAMMQAARDADMLGLDKSVKEHVRLIQWQTDEEIKAERKVRNEREGSQGKSIAGIANMLPGGGMIGGVSLSSLGMGVGMAAGIGAVGYGMEKAVGAGIQLTKVEHEISSGFIQNGVDASKIGGEMEKVNNFASTWSPKLAVSQFHLKELVSDASQLGGFIGEAALQVAKMSAAIEAQTGGKVTGEQFTKALSSGFVDDDGVISGLKRRFPAYAAAVKDATDANDLFAKTVKFSQHLIEEQGKYAETAAGRIESAANRGKDALQKTGQWLLGAIDTIGQFELKLFGAQQEEAEVIQKRIKLLEIQRDNQSKTDLVAREGYQKVIDALKKEYPAAVDAAKGVDLDAESLLRNAKAADMATIAAQKFMGLMDDERSIVSQSEELWVSYAMQKKKATNPEEVQILDDAMQLSLSRIKEHGAVIKEYNDLFGTISASDPSQISTGGKTANIKNPMKVEQTEFELHGIAMRETKEQIEIGLLQIQIKYDNLITQNVKNSYDVRVESALSAAHAEERIREIQYADQKKKQDEMIRQEERVNNSLIHADEIHFQFQLATSDEFDKKRLELNKKFAADMINAEGVAVDEVVKMYNDAWAQISKDQLEKLLKPQKDYDAKQIEEARKAANAVAKEWQGVFDSIGTKALDNAFKPIEDSLTKDKSLIGDIGQELLKIGEKELLKFVSKGLFPEEDKTDKKPKEINESLMKYLLINSATIDNLKISGGGLVGSSGVGFDENGNPAGTGLGGGGGGIPILDPSLEKRGEGTGTHFRRPDSEGSQTMSKKQLDEIELAAIHKTQADNGEITQGRVPGSVSETSSDDTIKNAKNIFKNNEDVISYAELLHGGMNGHLNAGTIAGIGKTGAGDNGLDIWGKTDLADVGKKIGKGFTDSTPKDFLTGIAGLIPGGSLITSIAGLLGFSEGGIVPRYYASGTGFVPRGTDTVPAMLTPGETVRTSSQEADLNRKFAMASYSGASGGSQGSSNDIVRAIKNLHNEISSLRGNTVTTRDIQLNNVQDQYRQNRKKLNG
jgi:hypothetical protein